MSTTFYDHLNPPPADRDAGRQKNGTPRVKPLEELPAVARELVLNGKLGEEPFTVPPLTRTELLRERGCLWRELATGERRLAQIENELLTAK